MTPEDFRDRWLGDEHAEDLLRFPSATLAEVNIPDESKRFLELGGLPQSASPFLDFEVPSDGPLESAAQQWQLSAEYNGYHVIGSNGSGDPICIDDATGGEVVYLNHDDNFRRILINSSISQLAESLLAFRHLVSETQKRNGEVAYLDGNIPDDLKKWIHAELARIDSAAVSDGCHWYIELANLSNMAP